jgi:hypothetical protein
MADEFGGIDTRSEILRIVGQLAQVSDDDDLRRSSVAEEPRKTRALARI